MKREASYVGERGPAALTLAGALGILALIVAGVLASPASSEVSAAGAQGGTGGPALTLDVPAETVPFAYPAEVEASLPGPAAGEQGTVTFLVDGERAGGPVATQDGSASTELTGLEPGDNVVTAVYRSRAGRVARASDVVAVDSAAPGPAGILPCAERSVVLTMAYRSGDRVNFEGVARYSLRGEIVSIRTGRRTVATAKVGSDGTYWTSLRDPRREIGPRTRFIARIGGADSWPRRVGQVVTVTGRSPGGASRDGSRITVEGLLSDAGMREVVLAKQVGCTKQKVVAIRQIGSARSGAFAIGINRPERAEPYAIYRLLTENGTEVSPPILVRSLG
jgi:hypothetical protein